MSSSIQIISKRPQNFHQGKKKREDNGSRVPVEKLFYFLQETLTNHVKITQRGSIVLQPIVIEFYLILSLGSEHDCQGHDLSFGKTWLASLCNFFHLKIHCTFIGDLVYKFVFIKITISKAAVIYGYDNMYILQAA
ncbi:hypothetical protein ACJX0J_038031 [Zea mays]